MNPSFITLNLGSALPVTSGGTGLTTIPTNGQLLIGNGTGYTLNPLTPGVGIGVTNGAGLITVANTGVLSNIAGTGISVSNPTGNVTIGNTGVLSWSGGSTGLTPATATTGVVTIAGTLGAGYGGTGLNTYVIGDLLYASGTTAFSRLADIATGNALISGGIATAPSWGKIGLTTHVSGILPIANGGTNNNATPTAGAIAYGTGTTIAYTAAGTAGQVLTSAAAGTPTWTTPTTGTMTAVSVVSANGLAGTSSGGATPALTLSTTVTGVVKGNGTALSAATAATDYVAPSAYASANGLTMATARLLGRTTASTGAAEEISVAGGLTLSAGTLTGASGTVTSVTGTSPVVSSGGATPAISMPAATTSVNGYLTSTDWTTFNNKGSGTVTSVTGTAPVVSSGGATPAISMAAATTSVNGYLTSTDWTTFNNKGSGTVTSVSGTAGRITSTGGTTPVIDLVSGIATPGTTGSVSLIPVVTIDTYGRVTSITTAANPQGTVTSVAALTLGTTGTDLSSTVATGTTTPVITLQVPTASASNRGALSAADWTTFNNKGSGTVTSVTGTAPVVSSGGATPAISMAAATTSVNGYLTSADWTTFNNKQPAGSYLVSGGALGTPSSGTVTNLTGTASININGTVGATTPAAGSFTTLSASGNTSLTGATVTIAPASNPTLFINDPTYGSAYIQGGVNTGGTGLGTYWIFNVPTSRGLSWAVNNVSVLNADATAVTMPAYGAGAATFSAAGVISSVSDERLKIKDGTIADPIPMMMALEPGYYFGKPEANMGEGRQLGFYAQNVRKAIGPEAAPDPEDHVSLDKDGNEVSRTTRPWGYYDRSVLAVAIEALKVHEGRLAALQADFEAYKATHP